MDTPTEIKAKKRVIKLCPTHQDWLADWPAWEVRTFERRVRIEDGFKYSTVHRTRWFGREQLERFEEGGWLTFTEQEVEVEAVRQSYGHPEKYTDRYPVFTVTRTDKGVVPYKEPERPKWKKTLVFPFTVGQQWDYMQTAGGRRVREQLSTLGVYSGRTKDLDTWSTWCRLPEVIRDTRELSVARFMLAWAFGCEHDKLPLPDWDHDKAAPVRHLMSTGLGLRLLCLDTLMEPVFEEGKCTGFRALDPDEATYELEEIVGDADTFADKYLNYMNRHGKESSA